MSHTLTRAIEMDLFNCNGAVTDRMKLSQWWQHNIRNKTRKYEGFPLQ